MSTRRSPSRDATHAFDFRDPSTSDQKTIDYYRSMAEAIIDAQEYFRRILREETGGRWLIMHHFGYLYELSDAPFRANYGGQTAYARRSLGSPTLDAAAGPHSCCFRGEGQPAGSHTTQHSWALDYVEYALEQNVVAGYGDGTYHPEYEVTRDQMAVYVARALVAPSGEAALADYVPADPRDFPDVPPTGYGDDGTDPYWAYKHIEYCVAESIVQGYSPTTYGPTGLVTRDQMAVFITRAFGLM